MQLHPGALHPLFSPHGVSAAHLYIGKEVVVPVCLLRRPHILRGAGAGVELPCRQHTAHHGVRHFFVRQLYRLCAGHQLVMGGLILDLLHILAGVEHQPCAGKGQVQQHVDLIKGEPVLHLAFEAVEQHLAVVDVGVHHAAVFPAAVFFDEGNGSVKVADGDQRLNAVLMALVKNAVVEGQSCLVGLSIVAVGQDAGPCNGQPEALEAHLCKQGDILFIMVIQVNGLVAGVEMCVIAAQHFHIARCHRKTVRAEGGHIHRSQTLAVCLPCTLALVGGGSAAPQKALGKFAHTLYLLVYFCAPAERRYTHTTMIPQPAALVHDCILQRCVHLGIKYDFYRQNAEISCCFLRTFHDKNTKLARFSFILFLLNRAAVW